MSTAPPRFKSKAADAADTQHARIILVFMVDFDVTSKEKKCRATRRPMRRDAKASGFGERKWLTFQKDI